MAHQEKLTFPPTSAAPHLQVDGESHVVHVEEEALGTRLIVNTLTCLLAKEVDPSRLVASSPGKLVRHLVAASDRVTQGQAYAEVEVRKRGRGGTPEGRDRAKLVRHLVATSDRVTQGQAYAEVEVRKRGRGGASEEGRARLNASL